MGVPIQRDLEKSKVLNPQLHPHPMMKNWMEFLELSAMLKSSMKMLRRTMNINFHKFTKKQNISPIHEKTNFLIRRLENYSLPYYQNCPQLMITDTCQNTKV